MTIIKSKDIYIDMIPELTPNNKSRRLEVVGRAELFTSQERKLVYVAKRTKNGQIICDTVAHVANERDPITGRMEAKLYLTPTGNSFITRTSIKVFYPLVTRENTLGLDSLPELKYSLGVPLEVYSRAEFFESSQRANLVYVAGIMEDQVFYGKNVVKKGTKLYFKRHITIDRKNIQGSVLLRPTLELIVNK